MAGSNIEWDIGTQGSPFRGLQKFEIEHRSIYFGRSRAIEGVIDRIRLNATKGSPIVIVFGKSGVGKSSFLRAGVLPSLIEPNVIPDYGYWRYAIYGPTDSQGDLFDGLAGALVGEKALPELTEGLPVSQLAQLFAALPSPP